MEDVVEVLKAASKVCSLRRSKVITMKLAQAALGLAKQLWGPHHYKYATLLRVFAGVVMNCDRYSKGTALFRQAEAILNRYYGGSNLIRARLYEEISYWYVWSGEQMDVYLHVYLLYGHSPMIPRSGFARVGSHIHVSSCSLYMEMYSEGDFEEAQAYCEKSLSIR